MIQEGSIYQVDALEALIVQVGEVAGDVATVYIYQPNGATELAAALDVATLFQILKDAGAQEVQS